jgi:hypothetical protein
MMRGRPYPLQRGHCTSRSATRMEASGSRGFTRRSKSTTVSQASQTMTSQWCFETSAAAILGQNQALPLAALKRRTTASVARCAAQSRFMRSTA